LLHEAALHNHREEDNMTRCMLVSGILVTVALGILGSSAGADHYVGPRKAGDKCYVTGGGSNGGFGHWETCKDKAGATASARISKSANKKSTGSSPSSASRSSPAE
jgi:hypothetical protein